MNPIDTPGPWHRCPQCSSTWFRPVLFQEVLLLPIFNPGRGYGMTLLVCACGALFAPPVTDPNPVVRDFLSILQEIENQKEIEKSVLSILEVHAARRKQVETLLPQLQELERGAGQLLARQDVVDNQRLPNGRHWRPPAAPKAVARSGAGTTRGRAWLEREVRLRGLTARAAHDAVGALFETIREAVLRDERVETPLGAFYLHDGPRDQLQRKRWGREQTLYQQRTKVKFRPDAGLKRGINQ